MYRTDGRERGHRLSVNSLFGYDVRRESLHALHTIAESQSNDSHQCTLLKPVRDYSRSVKLRPVCR